MLGRFDPAIIVHAKKRVAAAKEAWSATAACWRYTAWVDGTGTEDVGWYTDGWMKLGRYDVATQQRLEAAFAANELPTSHGNGALNAKRLGAPVA